MKNLRLKFVLITMSMLTVIIMILLFIGYRYDNYWDEEIYDQYPQIINKKIYELHEEIADAKYTLVYSQAPGLLLQ